VLLGWLLACYVRLVHRTTRWTVAGDPRGRAALGGPGGAVAVTWHGRMFLAPTYAPPGKRSVAMVSRSRDGDMFAAILRHWRIVTVRGSSHDRVKRRAKGGAEAFAAALGELTHNQAVIGITPDGPRGPRRQAQLGAARLASAARVPVIAIAFSVRWGRFLKSWDRFLLPFPFGRGAIVYGTPRQPPEETGPRAAARFNALIEADLNAVTRQADALCGRAAPAGAG
jgi:hypothetical protein